MRLNILKLNTECITDKLLKTQILRLLEAPSFVADVATKTNKSERSIQVEVQVATNIPERVQTAIKDLPVADNKTDLLKLSRFNETAQNQIADVLSTGKAEKVDDAIRILDKEFKDAQPKPSDRQITRSNWMSLIVKMGEFLRLAQTGETVEIVVETFNERERNACYTNAVRLRERLNQMDRSFRKKGATSNEKQTEENTTAASKSIASGVSAPSIN